MNNRNGVYVNLTEFDIDLLNLLLNSVLTSSDPTELDSVGCDWADLHEIMFKLNLAKSKIIARKDKAKKAL